MGERPKIPRSKEASLLFVNDHTCCICREKGKDVHLHHIDGNRENNNFSNLAVLCLDCHSKATGSRGLGKSYSETEVKKYKKDWEFRIRKNRGQILEPSRTVSKVESRLVEFEIRKCLYQFCATKNRRRAEEILELLDNITIFEGHWEHALEQVYSLVPFFDTRRKGKMIAEYVTHYLWGLVGPEDVRIRLREKGGLRTAVKALTWLAEYHAEIYQDAGVVDSCLMALDDVFETAHDYHLKGTQRQVIRSMSSIRKYALEFGGPKSSLARSARRALRYRRQMVKRVSKPHS